MQQSVMYIPKLKHCSNQDVVGLSLHTDHQLDTLYLPAIKTDAAKNIHKLVC